VNMVTSNAPSLGGNHQPTITGQEPRLGGVSQVPHLLHNMKLAGRWRCWRIAQHLARIGQVPEGAEAVVPGLVDLLDYSVHDVRMAAIWTLGAIGPTLNTPEPRTAAVNGLLGVLCDSKNVICQQTIWALRAISDVRAVPGLLESLRHPNSFIWQAAAEALGQMGDVPRPALLALLDDEQPHLRKAAAQALGWMGHPDAVPHLVKCLSDPDQGVRRRARWALEQIDTPEALAALEGSEQGT
jgi:HEAT repeat protein